MIGSHADAVQRFPGSGTVVTHKDIERAQPVDAAEMLRRVPGVQVRQEYSGGSRIDISVRGLDAGRSRRVLLLEDGIPLALNPYAEPDMNYAPAIERYDAIEVVKGSGNILFGPQTLAGTVNFVTIAPPDRPTAVADVEGGEYGYLRGLARYGDSVKGVRYVTQLLYRRGDGFRAQPFSSGDGLAKIAVPTGENGEAMVKLGFHRDDADSDDVGLTSRMWRETPRRPTLAPHDHLVFDLYDAALVHTQRFSSSTKLKTLVYGYLTDRVWRRQNYTRTPAPGDPYERVVGDTTVDDGAIYFKNTDTVLDRYYTVLGVEPRLEHRVTTGGVRHTFDVGARLLRETAHYEQRTGTNPFSYAGSLDYEEEHAGSAVAGYLQDRVELTDKLLVTPGVRVEYYGFRRTILRQSTGTGPSDTPADGAKHVSGVIPGAAMLYGTKRASVFAGMHVGFAPPRVTSAISPNGTPAEVSPERSINYELGSRTMPTKWWRVEATGFLSDYSNQVIVGSSTSAGNDAELTDAGATNVYGVESGTVLSIGRAAKAGADVDLGARYTLSRAVFRHGANAGNYLPYAPEHTLTANLDVEHPLGVGGEIAWTYVSSQFADAANTVAEDTTGRLGIIDGHQIVDATVHYKHRRSGVTVRLTAKNVLDATYLGTRRPEGIFPGGYRQILLGLRWEWEGQAREP